ncbi:MAG: polysaccharide deacetylase family protein [Verrucomicrobia bacterium]|nr:polysaccharide deacetylase family protein [Verrucomicrobiota bacterium]
MNLKAELKSYGAKLLEATAPLWLPKNVAVILMYHNVGDTLNDRNTITRRGFADQLQCLLRLGFRCLPATSLVEQVRTNSLAFGRVFAITFDDGRSGVISDALPVLREFKLESTLFVVNQFTDGRTRWFSYNKVPPSWISESESLATKGFSLEYADREMLLNWLENNQAIGGHSVNHLHLATLPDDILEAEVYGCAKYLEQQYGCKQCGFAFPYGEYNGRVVDHVKKYFTYAVSVEQSTVTAVRNHHGAVFVFPRIDPGRSVYEMLYRIRRLVSWNRAKSTV